MLQRGRQSSNLALVGVVAERDRVVPRMTRPATRRNFLMNSSRPFIPNIFSKATRI